MHTESFSGDVATRYDCGRSPHGGTRRPCPTPENFPWNTTDDDDWNVQGIVGGSYALSDTGALVVRYRMWNTGGFSSEDRLHVFTVGYRHQF